MRFTLCVAATLLFAVPAAAKTHAFAIAKVDIEIPDTWKVETSADSLMAKFPDSTSGVLFAPHDKEKKGIDQVERELESEMRKMFKGLTLEKSKQVTVNGLKGFEVSGTGELMGDPIEVRVLALTLADGTVLMGMAFAHPSEIKVNGRAIDGIFKSVRPSKGGKSAKPAQ